MDSPIATIKQGQLRGFTLTDIDGGRIFSFLGIPYAKPPIGELRFKAPLPAEPWEGIRDATKDGNRCYGNDLLTSDPEGSEDCLNLNVFTKCLPEGTETKLKPVMVWIHGGGFIMGSNRTRVYGPEFLLTEDIVLVSINYRLGALGFLSAEDVSLGVPGNAGLKDQTLALKWVQENIRSFNGDPDNVTIFGESAGSGSVHYQVLSPTTKGLFHKAIMQSGSALNHWALGQPGVKALAKHLGYDGNSEREALDLLMKASVEELFAVQDKFEKSRNTTDRGYFAPVIEKPNDTSFITEQPIDIIRSGTYNKVPLMFGYTSREGLLLVPEIMEALTGTPVVQKENSDLEDIIPWQIGLEHGSDASKQVCQKIAQVYFKSPNQDENIHVLTSDSVFIAGIMASVKNHSENSENPIYLYRMSIEAGLNIVKNLAKIPYPGACHGDDMGYLFKNILTPPIEPGSIEEVSMRRFVKLWTNFAKYGNPTPDSKELGITWRPVEKGTINFIDIDKKLTTGVNPEAERMQLWREIYELNPETECFL